MALLSLDDLYLAPDQRPVDISPLFVTRGVPGTHDVALGECVIDALKTGQPVHLPRFDKATDAPKPVSEWPEVTAPDIILLEGWCVGARPQTESDLAAPANELERERDPQGVWRRYVNAQLAGPYRQLFARIDRLVLLAAPGFEVVGAWRTQQEHDLSRMLEKTGQAGTKVMSDAQIAQFIQHYERLTRYILSEMPQRADLVLRLDANRTLL
ncbi:MAG: kinase [Asticcacaulis sp.]|uniref:kinase n=1 Tax=Asticcacaulis sp. TaxID=1872648 RepID=UPI0039E30EDD